LGNKTTLILLSSGQGFCGKTIFALHAFLAKLAGNWRENHYITEAVEPDSGRAALPRQRNGMT
jgi:hypothetical protein